jgi:hypothetical protein
MGTDGHGWARMGTDGHGWARMGTDGHGWARMGTDGHGWARMGTDGQQGDARVPKLALRFQIPPQASLCGILKTHRAIAPRLALLLRFAQGTRAGEGIPAERF